MIPLLLLACCPSAMASTAVDSLMPRGDRAPSGVQPATVRSLDGSWKLEIDVLSLSTRSPTQLELWRGTERVFHVQLERYPEQVCLSNAGTVALLTSPTALHQRGSVRVLGPDGSLIAEHAFDRLAPGDPRLLRIAHVAVAPELSAFCVLIDVYDGRWRHVSEDERKEDVGALVLLDDRTGAVTQPLTTWGRVGRPRKLVQVQGTRWLAVDCEVLEKATSRNEWVFLDAGSKMIGVLPGKIIEKGEFGDRTLDSPAPHEIVVRWPGAADLQHYSLALVDGALRAELGALELVPRVRPTPRFLLEQTAETSLGLPEDFVDSKMTRDGQVTSFAGLDARGRICVQDIRSQIVHVLEPEARTPWTIRLTQVDEPYPVVRSFRATDDGGFALDVGNSLRRFAANGQPTDDEAKGNVDHIGAGEGFWVNSGSSLYHMGPGAEIGTRIERHADRRFFTELGGVLREGDHLIVLDNTHWTWDDRIWRGRISTYALDGAVHSTRDLVLSPGQEDVKLIAAKGGWILLQGRTNERGKRLTSTSTWLVPADGAGARELEWNEPGRLLGFSPDGRQLWAIDGAARKLRRYALPQR